MQAEVQQWQEWCEPQGSSYINASVHQEANQEFQDCEDDAGEQQVHQHTPWSPQASLTTWICKPTNRQGIPVRKFPQFSAELAGNNLKYDEEFVVCEEHEVDGVLWLRLSLIHI